ncbi:MAG: DUF4249 domain-containing protein [Bacteroidales bacterium]|nr:DUF4249 domain-containing protein [Bacteroidales bacterium]MBN2762156.1 DUF4249 domain-containing protein [Bacteroidales bacterium]
MQVIRNGISGMLLLIFISSCIDPFKPEVEDISAMVVISGRITDQEGYHSVEVSKSTSYNDPYFYPVSNCMVTIADDKDNRFNLTEYAQGKYQCWIGKEFLNEGTYYHVEVITPDGKQYMSDSETILPCPPVEDVYFEEKTLETENPDVPLYGIQFYVDADASGFAARNFLWNLSEAWEYHSTYMVADYYDGEIHYSPEYYDSLFYCWSSGDLYDIITFTTKNLTSGKITRCPLNFVSNRSQRLSVKYSLLVSQYSISDEAYNYWNTLQRQSQSTGGFYETQPASIKGNIHCISHPDEAVLGYFMAAGITQKRIFVPRNFGFIIHTPYCELAGYSSAELNDFLKAFKKTTYPIFLVNLSLTESGPWDYAEQYCFDCRKRGGTLTKPDFWE